MKIHETATIAKEAEIDSTAEIGRGVIIEPDVCIGPNVKIKANAYICSGTEIKEGVKIYTGVVIGEDPQDYAYKGGKTFTKIGKNTVIREYVTIHRGTEEGSATVVGDNNFFMVQAHVGHNCTTENDVIIANGALLAGYVYVEKGAFISGNVVFHQFCKIGRYAMIGGFTGVNKDVPPYMIVRGPSVIRGVNLVGLRRAGFTNQVIREVKEAYKLIYLSGKSLEEAIEQIKDTYKSDEIAHLVSFVETSKRKICKSKPAKEDFLD